jgi:hypothetical protein
VTRADTVDPSSLLADHGWGLTALGREEFSVHGLLGGRPWAEF